VSERIALRRHELATENLLARFAAAAGRTRFYWRSADGRVELVAPGERACVEASGEDRLRARRRSSRRCSPARLRRRARAARGGPPWSAASASPDPRRGGLGGVSAAALLAARGPVRALGERSFHTETCRPASAWPRGAAARARAASAPRPRLPRRVPARRRTALDAIREGELEKLVVARSCTLRGDAGFDVARLLRGLRAQHPACLVFAVGRQGATFVGASPERLVRRRGERVQASVLAGSAPRGRTPEEDERLGRELCESKKEQDEHAIVRRAVCDALAPLRPLHAPEPALPGSRHPAPAHARVRPLRRRCAVRARAAKLFPTPAVAGGGARPLSTSRACTSR
jgi:isochorismate synthase EntC